MDLDDLHAKLSRDKNYVRAYEQLGGSVELAVQCRAVREDRGITQAELAAETGASIAEISHFEHLESTEASVISAIVDHLEPWLRERGVQTEQWTRVLSGRHQPKRSTSKEDFTAITRDRAIRPTMIPSAARNKISEFEEP